MKKSIVLVVLVILSLLLASTAPVYAFDRGHFRGDHFRGGGHVRVGVFVGPWWGWGPWWGPPYPYYYPYYTAPPIVIEQRPPVYVQQEQSYWYFCTRPEGYYPYVKQCPSGWLKVVPPSEPPDQGR